MGQLARIKTAMRQIGENGFAMKRRLQFYLFSLVMLMLALVLLLLSLLGAFSTSDKQVSELLGAHLSGYASDVASHFQGVAAQGLRLSERLTSKLERFYSENDLTPQGLNDHVDHTTQLELALFDSLEAALQITDCSGTFILLPSTVNTDLEDAEHSRSCLYLKLANVNISNPASPEILLFRGASAVAQGYNISFHNRWDLEYNLEDWLGADLLLSPSELPRYFFTETQPIPGTWERAMYLMVPIVSPNDAFYGVCGFEISAIYYKLAHAEPESNLNHVTGLLAKRVGDQLLPATGLESGMANGWFLNLGEGPLTVSQQKSLTRYVTSNQTAYLGVEQAIDIGPIGADAHFPEGQWVVTMMIPEADMLQLERTRTGLIVLFCTIFLAVALGVCLYLSHWYVQPILEGLARAKHPVDSGRTGILEIDDLLEFLTAQEEASKQPVVETELHSPNLESYRCFVADISTLTRAERAVFDLYMQGHTAREIAEMQHISINTVKTHNRHIYEKLHVSTYKELMIYVQMMQRQN